MMSSFLAGAFITAAIFIVYIANQHIRRSKEQPRIIKQEREKAMQIQRNVIKGQLAETMFPIIQKSLLGYSLGDMLFIGKLVDYIIVDGYSEAKDNGGEIRKVVFLDVKTGNAKLSAHQEKLKAAIQAGNVEWKTVHITNKGEVKII